MKIIDKCRSWLTKELPFVIYKKPNNVFVNGFFQNNDTLFATEQYETSGFVFAPFDANYPTYIFPKNECEVHKEELSFLKKYRSEKSNFLSQSNQYQHIDLITKGIQEIKSSNLKKIVLSREESISKVDFDCFSTFYKMLSEYENAFVYLWYHPKEGMWFGATPETLLKVKENRFHTMALASTQVYKGSLDVVWGTKEKDEHKFVTDYISNQIRVSGISTSNFNVSQTYTSKAGNLLHLKAHITGEITNSDLKQILQILHPTPAVCGLPTLQAKEFILKYENYNREFYSGFLGEIHLNDSSELYVNLRCAKSESNTISIFVGGGITKDSIPEKEWEETVAKSQTIKKVL